LEEGYHFLRRVEHRLQLLHDQQTHTLPDTPGELRALAVRLGYDSTGTGGGGKSGGGDPVAAFQADLAKRTADNRRILDHLLYDAFDDEGAAEPEVDLVNDPNPSKEEVRRALSRHPLGDPHAAYEHLMSLATERVRFLSPRRCRHFLASITPRLLAAIARTPDPVATLVSLSRASDSLGGKAALWELFSQNPGALNLYVRLCAAAPYLAEILTTNPGMIDELMDSLLVRRLPWHAELEASLADLTRGAEDLDPILHSFKNAQHLRVGVRDLLGRDDIRGTHRALADVAECCVAAIARREHARLIDRHGEPTIGPPDASHAAIDPADAADLARREGQPSAGVILAMGKLGGREPNYHSDLDLVFLYEGDGPTVPRRRSRRLEPTNNAHFYSELGQRIITAAGRLGPYGRLYEVDARLRPTGRGGALAVSIPALRRYFASGQADLWERLALCKARVISGEPAAAERAMAAVAEAAYGPAWRPEHAAEVRAMRDRLERSAGRRNLKRGPGGTIDTEFLVQTLQLRHGGADESIRLPGTLAALGALEAAGHLPPDDAAFFRESYRLQRSVESAVRLMNSPARHEYPNDPAELKKLAFLLGYPGGETLRERLERCRNETRVRFERLMGG
ncbi:MAG: bifunctional [glutamate--ammonia ligase]-adenylyl-L-tyrosine phosphorylase/[glutamate--ammonia-ligase] adenylyltransferase, partial [Planctomycetota bacterium]